MTKYLVDWIDDFGKVHTTQLNARTRQLAAMKIVNTKRTHVKTLGIAENL